MATAAAAATPGTLFRIYKDAEGSTQHYTAVLLKDGSVLEVKNPESPKAKTKFETLAAWRDARGAAEQDIKVSAPSEPAPGKIYPKNNKKINRLLRWYYTLMSEGAPHLLEREDVITSYKALVDVCHKYYDVLTPSHSVGSKRRMYSISYLEYGEPNKYNTWGSFPLQAPYYWDMNEAAKARLGAACEEIVPIYKAFYDLVHVDLHKYMAGMKKRISNAREIAWCESKIERLEKRIAYVTRTYRENIEYYRKRISALK